MQVARRQDVAVLMRGRSRVRDTGRSPGGRGGMGVLGRGEQKEGRLFSGSMTAILINRS